MRKIIILLSTLFFILTLQLSIAAPLPDTSSDDASDNSTDATDSASSATNTAANSNWYDDLFFTDKSFTFEFIRTLGYAYSGGADIGEAISTSKLIPDADTDGWYQQWLTTANRVSAFADKMQKQSDVVSSRKAYLRASNYYRTAGFYMVAEKDRPKSISMSDQSKMSFLQAIATLPFILPIKIPYETTALPGYLIRSPFKNAPLIIMNTGFDGTAEELYLEAGVAAYERGYNVILFEGPGQGEVLRKLNLPFRPDWEHVVTAVIDYAVTIPNINKNKIALMGFSMGGYLAARAAAFEPRIKACVLNGGVYDVSESVLKLMPADMVRWQKTNPEKFNAAIADEMKKNVTSAWFFNNAMWSLQATNPADVVTKLKLYTMKDIVSKIKCPTLVVDSEDDLFNRGQSKELYDLLTSPKTFLLFTKEEDAQAHCQMGAIGISNEKIFNWLSSALG